jgi:hypothetical protein
MDRKDLLLEERENRTLEDKVKVEKDINTGGALQHMLDTFGWKIVYEGFIKPNIEEARFLSAKKEDLEDVRAEIRVLRELMKFIETRVQTANKLAEKIKK